MEPSYHLGSRPEMEMHVRNFLSSVFFKEVAFGQERLWLETLLLQVSPMRDISTMSRVLLLISSPAKEQDWQFGVQWADHVEAIPATYAVVSSHYQRGGAGLLDPLHPLHHLPDPFPLAA